MVTTTGTVIQNGCCYKATKVIKNGAEIGLGGGGPKYGFIDILVVGGGGTGGVLGNYNSDVNGGGGGGAGGYIEYEKYPINSDCTTISIKVGASKQNSCFGQIIAYAGGEGGIGGSGRRNGTNGGSGGGGGGGYGYNDAGKASPLGQGNDGGAGQYKSCRIGSTYYLALSGGGGGAGGVGGTYDFTNIKSGNGGEGKCSCISGECCWYAGGGAGVGYVFYPNTSICPSYHGTGGCGGGGDGGCNATYYGGGGGGNGGQGYQGIVILRYHTNGSDGLLPTSFGGCKYTCGDYTIHCFTETSETQEFIPVFK